MVRLATLDDVAGIVRMAGAFVASTEYRTLLTVQPAFIQQLAAMLVESDRALALVSVDGDGRLIGMLGVLLVPHMMSGEQIASEVVWWMDPETAVRDGVKMLKQAEAWATEQGATVLQMIAPNVRTERFYELLQYTPIERSYQKRLR